nr:MAG TPA: hypothetical protein [Caudoviricetes sp.]
MPAERTAVGTAPVRFCILDITYRPGNSRSILNNHLTITCHGNKSKLSYKSPKALRRVDAACTA